MAIEVNGMKYDLEKFMKHHPGGPLFIKMFQGKDATEAFYTYHRRPFPHKSMEKYQSKPQQDKEDFIKVAPTIKSQKNNKLYADYFELVGIINSKCKLPNHGFAPTRYLVKIFCLLMISFITEYYMLLYGKDYLLSFLLGLCYAWIGLNIQHDANHGAISRNSFVNYVLGLTQNYIGGDNLKWIEQHVVNHHIMCNHYQRDPDCAGYPIFRFHDKDKQIEWLHSFQHIYLWLLSSFYGFVVCFSPDKISKTLFNLTFKLFAVLRIIVIPIYFNVTGDLSKELICISIIFLVAGAYLAFFFVISHNYVGAKHFQDSDLETVSLLKRQVESSSNVGGSFLCFINGGLNYQIEHHLFPRINHTYYPLIAPIVKEYCHKHDIKYNHFPTVYDNFKSTLLYMYTLGNEKTKSI